MFVLDDPRISENLAKKLEKVMADASSWANEHGTLGVVRNDCPANFDPWQARALKAIAEEPELAMRVSAVARSGHILSGSMDAFGPMLEALSWAMKGNGIRGPIFIGAKDPLRGGMLAFATPDGWNWVYADNLVKSPEFEAERINRTFHDRQE